MTRLMSILSLGVTLTVGIVSAFDPFIPTTVAPLPTASSEFSGLLATPDKQNPNVGVWNPEGLSAVVAPLHRRGQYVMAFCPESWHDGIPKPCSECGGDSNVSGRCDSILIQGDQSRCPFPGGCGAYCRCIPSDDPDPCGGDKSPGRSTSVTSSSSQSATVVWQPTTLSEYTQLQATTTVTKTELEQTATDGDAAMQTFEAVVYPGGLAWWVACQLGFPPLIPLLLPPVAPPPGALPGKTNCAPKPNCGDCGGASQVKLCTTGDKLGCPCDESQKCPNEPPMCTDPECGGDNGQSQCAAEGAINGCNCCPSDTIACSDNDCQGNELSTCEAKYKGCGCLWLSSTNDDSIGYDGPDAISPESAAALAAMVFTSAWGAKSSLVPGYTSPAAPSPTIPSIDCSKETNVPGRCGVPGCAYVIAKNLGPAALCPNNYCNCGGKVAPLITTTISGTASTGCGYSTVPTCSDCNKATCTAASTTTATANAPQATTTRLCRAVPAAWNPSWAPTVESTLNDTAAAFCNTYIPSVESIMPNSTLTRYSKLVDHLDYYYTAGGAIGYFNGLDCTDAPPQRPPSVDECVAILWGNWKYCDNHGLGGWAAIGCAMFSFIPTPYL